jgi:hypothetical protein
MFEREVAAAVVSGFAEGLAVDRLDARGFFVGEGREFFFAGALRDASAVLVKRRSVMRSGMSMKEATFGCRLPLDERQQALGVALQHPTVAVDPVEDRRRDRERHAR